MNAGPFAKAAERARSGVVFDLDGTLVHSAPTLEWAINSALEMHGCGALSAEEAQACIGHGLDAFATQALSIVQPRPAEPACRQVREAFLSNIERLPCKDASLRLGAMPLLESLRRTGTRIGICTNKAELIATKVVVGLCLAPFTDALIGGDTLQESKPHPEPLHRCFERLGTTAEAGLYIGDSSVDVATARAANGFIVLVRGGYEQQPVDALGADLVVDDLLALREVLFGSDRALSDADDD